MKNRKKIEDILLTDYGYFDDFTVDKLCDLSIVGNSLPERNSGEMWSFLLVNALRCLNEEQRAGLCFDLYVRNELQDSIDKRISELKKERQ